MVRIVIAGGAGNVAQEIISALVATKKHEIIGLTRRDVPAIEADSGLKWIKTDYSSVDDLVKILQGAHTVLSFIAPYLDQDDAFNTQKNLINASVKAGVKRFAPSEWVTSTFPHMDWYSYKATTRKYLVNLNKDTKVLEYCLFQPGLFMDYLTYPHKSAKYITPIATPFDLNGRRFLVVDNEHEMIVTLTTAEDLANIVVKAIDFEGEWPVIGGIKGTTLTVGELIALGEKIRGGKFDVQRLKYDDLVKGAWTASWSPKVEHPSISPEHAEAAAKIMMPKILLGIKDKGFVVSDEWNKLLPDYKFTQVDEFVERAWKGEQ